MDVTCRFDWGIVARFTGFKNIVWNIRHSKIEHTTSNLKTRAIILLSMFLSNAVPKKLFVVRTKLMKIIVIMATEKIKWKLLVMAMILNNLTKT